MRRDLVFIGLSLPLALVGAFMLTRVDFSHTPRRETIGGDVGVLNEGCLDWWCRGQDVLPAALATVLLAAAAAALVWGARRRKR